MTLQELLSQCDLPTLLHLASVKCEGQTNRMPFGYADAAGEG